MFPGTVSSRACCGKKAARPSCSSSMRAPRIRQRERASCWRMPNFLIRRIIDSFIKTARLAQQSGYDGVEIHAADHSLAAAFLSPAINHRRDAWGATQLARFKFVLDIVRGIRKAAGEDFIIGVHFNLVELSPHGADWAEMLRFTQMLRIAGTDYLRPEFGGFEICTPSRRTSGCRNAGFWRRTRRLP